MEQILGIRNSLAAIRNSGAWAYMQRLVCMVMMVGLVNSAGCSLNDSEKYLSDLKSENITTKMTAIKYVGDKRKESGIPILIEILKEQHRKEVTICALRALGNTGSNKGVDAVLDILHSGEKAIRIAAVETLGILKSPKAVQPLIELLNDDEGVRLCAIWALGRIGDKSAIAALTKLLDYPDKYVRYNSERALVVIGRGK